MNKPKVFWLHFNRFGARRGVRSTWTVRTGRRNHYAAKVVVRVPVLTIYRGDTAPQPRAYLKGVGCITRRHDKIIIERGL